MLKKITSSIILLFISWFAHPQDTNSQRDTSKNHKIKFGVNVSVLPDLSFEFKSGIRVSTQAVFTKNKITVLAGPLWWIYKNKDTNKFKGGIISLRYFPHKMYKTLNFYFMYDLNYFIQTNEWSRYLRYTPTTSYNVDFKSKIQTLRNQIGYGFNLRLYKGLFFSQSLSFGMDSFNYKSTTSIIENPVLSEDYSSGNIFSTTNASSTLKAGLEFHFE